MYQQTFSRSTPGCIMFLIDRSDSMRQPWGNSGLTLAEGAARAINKILLELCVKSTKEQGGALRRYFYVGIYGYGLCPSTGGEGVESALPGSLADARHRPAARTGRPSDRGARGAARWTRCRALAGAGVDRARTTASARRCARRSPPRDATCIRLGERASRTPSRRSSSTSPTGWSPTARTTAPTSPPGPTADSIATTDGRALLFNIFLSPPSGHGVWFPREGGGPARTRVPQLFAISSALPSAMIDNARAAQIDVVPGARGFVFNADLAMLVKFLEIGTRFEVQGSLIDVANAQMVVFHEPKHGSSRAGVGGRGGLRSPETGDWSSRALRRGRRGHRGLRLDPLGRPARRVVPRVRSGGRAAGADPRGHGRLVRGDAGALGGRTRPPRSATIFEERKFHDDGSFATLLGCEIPAWTDIGRDWRAVALGERVLFHVRGTRLVAQFPELAAEPTSGSDPDGVFTQTVRAGPDAGRLASGRAAAGGRRSALPRDRRACQVDGRARGNGSDGGSGANSVSCEHPGPFRGTSWPAARTRRAEERRRDAAARRDHRVRPRRLVVCRVMAVSPTPRTTSGRCSSRVRRSRSGRCAARRSSCTPSSGSPCPLRAARPSCSKPQSMASTQRCASSSRRTSQAASGTPRWAGTSPATVSRIASRAPAWVDDAIAINGATWPIVQMEWIEGRSLDAYVAHLARRQ